MAMVDRDAALGRLQELLSIPGRSGEEAAVAEYLRVALQDLEAAGGVIEHDRAHEQSPDGGVTGNLICRLPGRGALADARPIMFSGHMDTVPLCVGCKPVQEGERIVPTGRETALGADNRSACAAIATAVLTLLQSDLDHRPLTLVFFVQEEIGMQGAHYLDRAKIADPAFCVNIDGGDPANVHIGAIGALRWRAEIHGIASHAGVHPEDGVSAASIFALALAELVHEGWHGKIDHDHVQGTSNIGTVQGGDANNVVMDTLAVTGECRSHDPEGLATIVAEFERAFCAAAEALTNAAGQTGSVDFQRGAGYPSFSLPETCPAAIAVAAAIRRLGREPVLDIVNGGLDANFLNVEHQLETVTIGAGAHGPHTVDEYLDINEYLAACELLIALATGD